MEKNTGPDGSPRSSTTELGPPKKLRKNKFAFACAMIASMASILLGYDAGVMTGAALFIQEDLNITDVQVEFLIGTLSLYSLIGSTLAGRTSDWLGRRCTIIFVGIIFFVGALLMGFAANYTFLMFGRFVAGIGVGYALMIAPVYTAELSPATSRGFLTSFPEVFINVGIMLGFVSNYAFSKLPLHLGWRFMLGVGAIPSILLSISVFAMPESPRWLIMQGRLGEARRVLEKTSDSKEEADTRLAEIKDVAGIPQECNEDVIKVQKRSSHGEGVWRELLLKPSPPVRRVLIAAIGIHFFQPASGISTVVLYSPRIFKKAGIMDKDQLLGATIAVGFTKTVTILIATFLVDRIGRRPLLLTSVGSMILFLLTLGFAFTIVDHSPDKKVMWAIVSCIVMVLAYVSAFSIGLGPITWVYSSEIFPLRLRAQGTSMAVAVNLVTGGVLTITFISLYKAITIGGVFFMYAGVSAIGWIFFYVFLPETRGKTLEDMDTVFDFSKSRSSGGKNGKVQMACNGPSVSCVNL